MNTNFIVILTLLLLATYTGAQNPLQGKEMYVHPSYQASIDLTIQSISPLEQDSLRTLANLRTARTAPSAYLLDVTSKVQVEDTSLESMNGILMDAAKKPGKPLVVFTIMNLPNKNCGCNTTFREICCSYLPDNSCDFSVQNGTCTQGLDTYKRSYVNNIVSIINKHKSTVPMALIIEPNSIGYSISNENNSRCGSSTMLAYKEGLQYTINEISRNAPDVPMYMDLGHGGWLGWQETAQLTVELIVSLNVLPKIRGFATNSFSYQPLGIACPSLDFCAAAAAAPGNNNAAQHECCSDPCKLTDQKNMANNELNYVLQMESKFPGKYFVIDTGRNGVPDSRSNCLNWCNIRNAGLGTLPTTNTQIPAIDAFLWIKTPGETDGCTQSLPSGGTCPRFDSICASPDAIGTNPNEPRMPVAGNWSEYQMRLLAKNAQFGGPATALPKSSADRLQYPVFLMLFVLAGVTCMLL